MTLEDDARRLGELAAAVPVDSMARLRADLDAVGVAVSCVDGGQDVAGVIRQICELAERTTQQLRHLRKVLQELSGYHLGGKASDSGGDHVGGAVDVRDYVVAPDGSRYPRAAAWCVDKLPRRVRRGMGTDRTVGFVAGSETVVESGGTPCQDYRIAKASDVWKVLVAAGFDEDNARFLRWHVEMKIAVTMVAYKRWKIEVVINNTPCPTTGSARLGCGDALDKYLSWVNARVSGDGKYSLTVHGTTEQGEPFSETYPRGEQA